MQRVYCIIIGLNEIQVENDRNNKFSYVKEYFNELKHIERLKKDLQIVKDDASKAELEYKSAVEQINLSYADNPDSQKKPSETKKVSIDKTLMNEKFHKKFHPNPQQTRYPKKQSHKKRYLGSLKNHVVKMYKKILYK